MLKIGDFSKLSRISIRNLRHYDELGLLVPENVDRFTGYRYYTEHQLITAGRISALREMGFGLAAIGDILRRYHDPEALAEFLTAQLVRAQEEADKAAQRVLLLETAIERLRKDENTMEYNVTIKTLPERKAASVRMTIPKYEQEGLLWQTLLTETDPLHMQEDDPCYCCAIFHDKEFKEADVDVEVQKTVKGNYPDTEHVHFKTLPPVIVASITYNGAYDRLGEVYAAAAAWIEDNGYAYDGPIFNIYHISPHETQNPEEFVTEVCYPVRKK